MNKASDRQLFLNTFVRIVFCGWIVLIVAIFLNGFSLRLGLANWYSFIYAAAGNGMYDSLSELSVWDILYLFVLYPFFLGAAFFVSNRLIDGCRKGGT